MTRTSAAARIREKGFQGELREDEPLHRHLSLRVGGPAALYAVADTVADMAVLLACLRKEGIPGIVLGGGTNVIFSNGGYSGCVIRLGAEFSRIQREEEATLQVGAAVSLPGLLASTVENGLSGLECVTGIPGSVGGAVRMNAGTREGEIKDVIREVLLYDGTRDRWAPAAEVGFSYRSSGIAEGEIILAARLDLSPSSPARVRSRTRELAGRRSRTQPAGLPSAGCWFRNPEGDSAGRLIDSAGLKGERCGGAQVSEVHANFLVNVGGATASDFLTLAEKIRVAVEDRFGIVLQEEVRVIDE